MAALRELFTLLGFRTDPAGAAAYEARLASLKNIALGASAAVTAIGVAAAASVSELLGFAGATKDTADTIGITAEALQELDFAAKIGGSSAEAMRASLLNLSAASAGVTAKGKAVAVMLRDIGVATKDSTGKAKGADALFTEVATALAKVEDPGKRAAIAMRVFGGAGRDLLPLLNEGPEGLARLRAEANELGGVLSGDTIDAAEALGDELDKLHVFATGLSRTFAAALLPAIRPIVDSIILWAKENRGLIATNLQGFARDLGSVLAVVADVIGGLTRAGIEIVDAFGGVRNVILLTALGFAILNVAMLPAILVFAAVAAGFALIALVVGDIAAYEKHGDAVDSVTGRLKKMFVDDPIQWEKGGLVVLLQLIAKTFVEIENGAKGAALAVSDFMDWVSGGGGADRGTNAIRTPAEIESARKAVEEEFIRAHSLGGLLDFRPKAESKDISRGTFRQTSQRLVPVGQGGGIGDVTAADLSRPWLAPMSLGGAQAATTTTDNRVMTFNIRSTEPRAAAEEVQSILRDANTSQVVE